MKLINTKIKAYTLLREISAGQNSILFYAKYEPGAEVAIKVLTDDADLVRAALRTHFCTQAKLLVAVIRIWLGKSALNTTIQTIRVRNPFLSCHS
ncbi:hypothetical protein DYBT9275_02812 [Dyadobacter sp. CECT 9275]|uniref:Uncharacterized protein n=1 Tax=Dyadobacter helix TaxID=2822344 RepID=A0A916NLP7_9BACT|nr:hypothetical protein [Dyadobacter sp. CECT 9275]CAG5002116.1 hypothetical protein DYBT9275_02812 [Dyadobacter sp. CECT 9275]